jgi:hypothetical protein
VLKVLKVVPVQQDIQVLKVPQEIRELKVILVLKVI